VRARAQSQGAILYSLSEAEAFAGAAREYRGHLASLIPIVQGWRGAYAPRRPEPGESLPETELSPPALRAAIESQEDFASPPLPGLTIEPPKLAPLEPFDAGRNRILPDIEGALAKEDIKLGGAAISIRALQRTIQETAGSSFWRRKGIGAPKLAFASLRRLLYMRDTRMETLLAGVKQPYSGHSAPAPSSSATHAQGDGGPSAPAHSSGMAPARVSTTEASAPRGCRRRPLRRLTIVPVRAVTTGSGRSLSVRPPGLRLPSGKL
jgi:hypothetical protein